VLRVARLIALALLLAACDREREQPAAQAPIILISIDTLRADRLPAYGYTKVATPHIDALRRDGILFDNAYSHCPMTLPSHVSMLTGLLPTEHGVRNNLGYRFEAEKHRTLPQLLKQHGYATGAAVSSYVLRADTGLGTAFDWYDDAIPVATSGAASQHQRPGTQTLAAAKQWIQQHQSQPFFLMFHIYEPHAPYEPTYDGEVEKSDAITGELIAHLKQLGLYDRAIVVLTSDHGEGLYDHGEDQHGILLYREVLQVPLIVKLPSSSRAGTSVKAPAALIDLFPTIAKLAGVSASTPKGVDLFGEPDPKRRIYAETFYPRIHLGWSELRSLVDGRHHYIQAPRAELYDLAADPRETKDVAADERRVAASMREELATYPAGIKELQTIDPEDAAKLAALGYVGSAQSPNSGAALPNPRDMLPYLTRIKAGFKLADERKLDEAVRVLEALVKENPGLFDVWDKLGELLVELGRYEDAIRVYREAMQRAQRFSPEMALSLGDAYLKANQPEEAERYAQLAMKSLPAGANALLARATLARHNYVTAERAASAAIGTHNPQPAMILLLADIRRARGDLRGALTAVEAAEARAKELHVDKLHRLDFIRGDVLARMERVPEAIEAYRREIANFPSNTQAYANLAIIYFITGQHEEMERVLDAMVTANPHAGARALAAKTRRELK
jgi:arylsulfatase A-like enzyme/thioredoxin-like negative regulator of GroEL